MKKIIYYIIVGICAILIIATAYGIFISFEDKDIKEIKNKDLVEIYNVTVKTKWSVGYLPNVEHYTEDGFFHEINMTNVYDLRYEISGIVKNVAGRKLNTIVVSAKLYDSNNNYLGSSNPYLERGVTHLPNTYTGQFFIEIREDLFKYFRNVDNYELVLRVD